MRHADGTLLARQIRSVPAGTTRLFVLRSATPKRGRATVSVHDATASTRRPLRIR